MKKIILVIALLAPIFSFSQSPIKNIRKYRKLLAHKEFLESVKMSEFLVHPEDYIPYYINAKNIRHIEFIRDTNYNKTRAVYACISEKDGFDKIYSIGHVSNYQSAENELAFQIRIFLKDGSVDGKHILFDFSNGVTSKEYEYYEADYDVEGEPFGGQWDGVEVVAI